MTVTAALREAYASGDTEGVVIETLEIDHASLDAAIRLVRNVDSQLGQPGDTLALPVEAGGARLPHLLCAFDVVAPGADSDGPTEGRIRIDAVSHLIHGLLKGVIGYNEAIRVTIRFYRVLPGQIDAVTGPDDDSFDGLEMTTVDLSAERAEGTIAWPDGRQQNVPSGPNAFFDRDQYPALFS
ncbi:DUF1833 family protein [Methylobacterium dankookense]|uniref:DUF1833 domain-containing protein n=1 Tax=Methylobacterium dankookense TaxID=560405 RepID=A0A564G3P6_9HYPH|nr:DUF1833 family protein [Methylobacterium dankookense]GJD58154.1 hypothetical protein IFDJLNFL_4069 [Methylobacterium dankookense]VUF15105.1 hypothetical protein MTDSW087_04838 [Methylobacterium dankookense]